jgi:peptidoglycan/LPS O-acetylase OafA/YrhL
LAYPAHFASLTRLRFFAALWVVFYHWRVPWAVEIDAVTDLLAMGRFGVDLFFILSGFVLAHVYIDAREHGRFDFKRFIIARFARIWPLHITVILFLLAVWAGATLLNVPFEQDQFALRDLPANILMIHAWGFAPDQTWNGPSWSISAEWFAYLAFPAYLMIAARFSQRPWMLLGVAALLFFGLDLVHSRLFGETLPMATERFGVIRIIPEFLIGIALYNLGRAVVMPRLAARFALAVVLFVYLWAAHSGWDDRVVALLGAPLIFLLAELDRHAGETRAGALTYLGDVSYSIYMLHVPFFMVAFNALQDVAGVIDQSMSTSLFAALLILLLAASAMTFEWIEKPARIYLRKLGDQWLAWPDQQSDRGR